MNSDLYAFGVKLALHDVGLTKTAYDAAMNMVPGVIGGGLGLGLTSMLRHKLPGLGKALALPLIAGGALAGLNAGHRLQGGMA